MQLITTNDLSKAIGTEKLPINAVINFLLKVLKLDEINELYAQHQTKDGVDFIDHLLKEINITIKVDALELERIPQEGAFITISNHPFGAIDGLILLSLLVKRRPDYKIMANFLLSQIEQLKNYVFAVNPFEKNKGQKSSVVGMKQAMQHVKNGFPVGIFPAGEVSSYKKFNVISDKEWNPAILKFIEKSGVPIIPLYFHGSNSAAFHLLGLINPYLRTAKLPGELLNKRNKTIQVRIGKAISPDSQFQFVNTQQYGKFLRAKTYSLGSSLDVQQFFKPPFPFIKRKQQEIIHPISRLLLEIEVNYLEKEHLLYEWNNYQIFCAPTSEIPYSINEIGRLREHTFRKAGEGTFKSQDVDEFDLYYQQLFIWDKSSKEIIGGYRIGKGDEIYHQYGKKGFYLNSLFSFKKDFNPILKESIELGRSFVVESYQKKAFPLFCLWKGILLFLAKNSNYRYVLGPVSISNSYSNLSKNLIIDFVKNHFYDKSISKLVKPRKKHKINYKTEDYSSFLSSLSGDINQLDKIIEEIETQKQKVPVLFKKYLAQNAKIIGFNKDPKFNNSLDGLMLLDVSNLPCSTLKTLSNNKEEYHYLIKRFFWNYYPNNQLFFQL